jgi:hypothetical protein
MNPINISNNLNNHLISTTIDDAYKYETHSDFIRNLKPTVFSPICIFCLSKNTKNLTKDAGSFKQCLNCNKQFRATIVRN